VFNDLNRNSVQEPDEPGVRQIWVWLQRGSTLYGTAQTNAVGRFSFTDLEPGLWTINLQLPPNLELVSGSNPTMVLVSANARVELIFPVASVLTPTPTNTPGPSPTPTATPTRTPTVTPTRIPGTRLISGTVFLDNNRNTVQDPDEPGLAGVLVYLGQGEKLYGQVHTDQDGRYRFSDMDPGMWELGIQVPADMELVIATNPVVVMISANTTLEIPFALAKLPTPTPSRTATATPTPTSTPSAEPPLGTPTPTPTPRTLYNYLPLLLGQGRD
jgi:serine-aspartate repeat-containing protein C/D/E